MNNGGSDQVGQLVAGLKGNVEVRDKDAFIEFIWAVYKTGFAYGVEKTKEELLPIVEKVLREHAEELKVVLQKIDHEYGLY